MEQMGTDDWHTIASAVREEGPPVARPMKATCVVAVFDPDEMTVGRVAAMAEQAPVVAVDDGSPATAGDVVQRIGDLENVSLLRVDRNSGIGNALNLGIKHSLARGAAVVFTFDQDSTVSERHVDTVLAELSASTPSDRLGVLCPTIVPTRAAPTYSRWEEVDVAIQSGMAIPRETLERVGLLDASLFIDGVDTDYCLRVRRQGLRVVTLPDVPMTHVLGAGSANYRGLRCGPFRPVATGHSPDRRYYINRNTVRLVARHGRHEPAWAYRSLRSLVGANLAALLLENHRLDALRAIIEGLAAGLLGKVGPRPIGRRRASWTPFATGRSSHDTA